MGVVLPLLRLYVAILFLIFDPTCVRDKFYREEGGKTRMTGITSAKRNFAVYKSYQFVNTCAGDSGGTGGHTAQRISGHNLQHPSKTPPPEITGGEVML
jgi:hypothetical protein